MVAVLDEQVGLRRALSDPSIDGTRKAALAKAVLGSHVSDITLRIVTEVVAPDGHACVTLPTPPRRLRCWRC